MRVRVWTPLLLGLLAPACPSDDGNPRQLWLANDMEETRVKLIDHEPEPF